MLDYIMILLLLLFIPLSILQGWWIYKSLNKFLLMRDMYSDLSEEIIIYMQHLNQVHSMERFYGEPVLEQLIEHGKETVLAMERFVEVFEDFEEEGAINFQELDADDAEEEE